MNIILLLVSGLLFGTGLIISGMSNPAVVLGFLDPLGQWDPSLALVMIGGLLVTFFGYRYVLKFPQPFFNTKFNLPSNTKIDSRLIIGSMMFGIGWGLVGLCPGPALVAIIAVPVKSAPFFLAMMAGIFFARRFWASR